MSNITRTVGAMALAVTLATPALGQYRTASPVENRMFFMGLGGGGFSSVRDLNDAGTANFKTGFNVFGSIGTRLYRYLAIRGDLMWGRNQLRTNGVETGVRLNRFFYGAALQAQYPFYSGFTPYAFVGGGGITLDPSGSSGSSHTTGAGIVGLGLEYPISGTGVGVFAQGTGLYYKISELEGPLTGFSRNQFDITYSGGLTYRIPF
jgi:hypothetical protein